MHSLWILEARREGQRGGPKSKKIGEHGVKNWDPKLAHLLILLRIEHWLPHLALYSTTALALASPRVSHHSGIQSHSCISFVEDTSSAARPALARKVGAIFAESSDDADKAPAAATRAVAVAQMASETY